MVKRLIRIFREIIRGYFLWIRYKVDKSYRNEINEEANRKISICETCEYFNNHLRICNLCGCFMDIKTKSADNSGCYANKW